MSDFPAAIPKPGPDEVRLQLKHILSSGEFVDRHKPGEVFAFLVEEFLNGRTPIERDIQDKHFPSPPYDPEGTNARNAVSQARELLKEFYESTGRYDAVVITLPKKFSKTASRKEKGLSYPVVCSYNPNRDDLTLYKLGQTFMHRGTPVSVHNALEAFNTILRKNPLHRDAQIARLECLCLIAMYIPDARSRRAIIDDAIASGQKLAQDHPSNWRIHMLLAVALFCGHFKERAIAEAAQTIQLDPDHEMRKKLWFALLCLFTGKVKSACGISYGIAMERVNDSNAWAAYGFCLYLARKFEKAEEMLNIATGLDAHSWPALIGHAILSLAMGNPEKAFQAYVLSDRLVGELIAFMPSVAMLAASRAPGKGLMTTYLLEQVRALLQPDDSQKDWMQIALVNVDDPPSALNALRLAWHFYHPLALLIPWWPVFDPYRDHPEFDKLMQEIIPFPRLEDDGPDP